MIRRPPRSTHCISSAASDVYKRQDLWVDELVDSYESAALAAEAEARAAAREAQQLSELAEEKRRNEEEWRARLSEAEAYDMHDSGAGHWGGGWDETVR